MYAYLPLIFSLQPCRSSSFLRLQVESRWQEERRGKEAAKAELERRLDDVNKNNRKSKFACLFVISPTLEILFTEVLTSRHPQLSPHPICAGSAWSLTLAHFHSFLFPP